MAKFCGVSTPLSSHRQSIPSLRSDALKTPAFMPPDLMDLRRGIESSFAGHALQVFGDLGKVTASNMTGKTGERRPF